VTWNDYEEGSENRVRLSNCVSVAATVLGTLCNGLWKGNVNTVDHYVAYIQHRRKN